MYKLLIVGGTFDSEGGKPSKLIGNIEAELLSRGDFDITTFNGGLVEELHNGILPTVVDYNVVLWFANVSNDEVKLRDVKAINHKVILVTSKRNDDCKYTFAELINRSLAIKANLTIEFAKQGTMFNMMLFDPLGNVFYDGFRVSELCDKLTTRVQQLLGFTRIPSVQETELPTPEVPDELEFFSFAHSCADIFHNLIRPAKDVERFLGNLSFRCQNGFPSFRGENGLFYVSRRNVDKADISASSFVPVYIDKAQNLKYFGEVKPSVDTPIQLSLYRLFPWANYMIHAHCYVDTSHISGSFMIKTTKPIPCGAIEEVNEIMDTYIKQRRIETKSQVGMAPRLLAVNLAGHGCILIAQDVEILKELQKHKDNCFCKRPMPEVFKNENV